MKNSKNIRINCKICWIFSKLDLNALKPSFAFFADHFHVDVISDGFPVPEISATNLSAAEIELLELKEDLVMKRYHKSHSIIDF